jgi:NADPH:quinone reductase-like Zn-dependent oxidoreductase
MSKQMMRAIRVHQLGGPEQLKFEESPRPEPQAGEVLVRIYTTGVLPIEWKTRQGLIPYFKPELPYIPGSAFAGVIEELGPGVTGWEIGQEVFGKSTSGAYAEYATAASETIALKPASLSFEEAAAISGGATTAWDLLFDREHLQAGQRVLILGGAGGVGSFAVQFARWKGAEVAATASAANLDFVRSLGAETVIDYRATTLESRLHNLDLVFDTVGGQALETAWPVVKRGGALISIASQPSPEKAQELGIRAFFFVGSPPTAERFQAIARLMDEGHARATIARTFPLQEASLAHELSQHGHGRGRIVLRIAESTEK